MAFDLHTVAALKGSTLAQSDRLLVGLLPQQSFGAGGGAGQAVTLVISGLELPANYMVFLGLPEDATGFVTSRTQTGFTVNVEPRLAANTLASGKVDILIVA